MQTRLMVSTIQNAPFASFPCLKKTVNNCTTVTSLYVRQSRTLNLGFWILVIVSKIWILDCNRWWDSAFLELYSGLQSSGFRILRGKISRIPEFGFPYIGQTIE